MDFANSRETSEFHVGHHETMKMPKPLKWIFYIIGTLTALVCCAVILMFWFFSMLMGEPSKDEVSRVVSPNGKVDAVMCETNGGATTSFGYDIYVVEHGKQPFGTAAISLYGAVRSKSAYGANLEWISPDSVAVEYLTSKSLNIKKPTQIVGNQTIHFVIQKGIIDNNAPPGGMVYNLRGRQ